MSHFLIEGPGGISQIKLQGGYNSALPITTTGLITGGSGQINGNLVVTGTLMAGSETTTSQVITAASANAFAVGANGTTNPAFNVDTSTSSVATGFNIKGAAAAGGVALSVLSSGTNESATIDAKGTGTIGINTTSTTSGIVTIGNGTSLAGVAVNGLIKGTSASANALSVGLNGTTNPAFNVDASTAVSVTGVNVKSAASGGGVVISAISSATNENLSVNAKGSGTLNLNQSGGFTVFGGNLGVTSTSANALAVGPANVTNPTLNIDSSVGSAVTGLNIQGQVSGGGLVITTISSGSNEALSIAAKGTGAITFNPAVVAAAGGKASSGIQYGSIAVGLYTGTGAPSFSAMNGSIYTDSNATTTTTRIYVNKSGAGTAGTTWTALTTAA